MNLNFIILLTTLFYVLNFIVSMTINNNNHYIQQIDVGSMHHYIDYEYELIKVKKSVANNIHNIIMNNDNIIEYEFNINCYRNTCNEDLILKYYNLTIEEQEISIINFIYNIFDNITITKKQNNINNCCNIYLLTWS